MILRSLRPALFACILAAAGALPAFASGVLTAGSDVSYAPLEFYAKGSHAVEGFDFDLARAVATQMGDRLQYTNHDFGSLLKAVDAGTFDIAISAISDTRAREKHVDFVDYFLAGSGMLVPAGNPHHIFNLDSLCGMTVDMQRGTAQQLAVEEASKTCVAARMKPIAILTYATDEQALRQFLAGKSVAHISDYPVVAYLARTLDSGHAYVVAGRQFGVIPYGIAIRKGDTAERTAVVAALKAVIADGVYDRLLKKWGLEQGAMRSAPVNAGTLFQ